MEKESTADDADKSSEKVPKKSSEGNNAKSTEKGKSSRKSSAASEKTKTKDKVTKGPEKSPSSKKKHPERPGDLVKVARALEEESRTMANRVSHTPKKIKNTTSLC